MSPRTPSNEVGADKNRKGPRKRNCGGPGKRRASYFAFFRRRIRAIAPRPRQAMDAGSGTAE